MASALSRTSRPTDVSDLSSPQDWKDTAQSRVYEKIKDAVLVGGFLPGETVTLRKLSEMFGTSEMPVREALRRLIAEGAFETLPNRSARVFKPTHLEIIQIVSLRQMLEGEAARIATENISRKQIEILDDLHARGLAAGKDGDLTQASTLHKHFHFLIYGICENPVLYNLIEMLWLRISPITSASIRHRLFKIDHHPKIVAAFRKGDGDAAVQAMHADVGRSAELIACLELLDN